MSRHQEFSGKKIQYFDTEQNTSYVPYVVETSIGLDRTFLALISAAYCQEKLEGGEERVVMKIHPALAPVKVAVLPLVKKEELTDVARKILDGLRLDFNCQYEEKDTIGKRYRRQDAIGTPYCVTVDFDTISDGKVTLRDRDTMSQERVAISDLRSIVEKKVSIRELLRKI